MILPAPEDRGIVVFHVAPALAYGPRLWISFVLMAGGLAVQSLTVSVFPGVVLIAIGNLLLLVRGYDNRVDARGYDPLEEWERVPLERLRDLRELDRAMRRWDASALDATSALGLVLLLMIVVILGGLSWLATGLLRVLVVDAAVLLVPHWLTGIRSILVKPKLMVRVDMVDKLIQRFRDRLADHQLQLLMLLRAHDSETRIPDDLKFKVDFKNQREGFLGLNGQVSLNEVNGRSYPYFYVVLVARSGYGLGRVHGTYVPPDEITAEFDVHDQVEVLVIRQTTTQTSGYHTKFEDAARILEEGLRLGAQTSNRTALASP